MEITAETIYSTPIEITIKPIIRDNPLMPEAPNFLTMSEELFKIK